MQGMRLLIQPNDKSAFCNTCTVQYVLLNPPLVLQPTSFTTNTLTVYVLKAIRLVRVADWRDASPEKVCDLEVEPPHAEITISTPVMRLFPLFPFVQLTSLLDTISKLPTQNDPFQFSYELKCNSKSA